MDRVLCVSQYTRDRLVIRLKVPVEKTVLFPNTAQLSASPQALPREALVPGNAKIIFTVSRLWPEERYKKIDRVIEAMPAVLKAVPDALYVIAGQGADRPRLERLARTLGVEAHVQFAGALSGDRLAADYQACDVFILPSLGEGFGIVFLEAMACGKACIGAAAGAIPEVIQEGRTGLLVEPDDASAIAGALVRLLQDDRLRQAMGQAGRERYAAEFAPGRFRERLARITEQAS